MSTPQAPLSAPERLIHIYDEAALSHDGHRGRGSEAREGAAGAVAARCVTAAAGAWIPVSGA